MFEHASRFGLEGIVSKRGDLPYRPGRGDHWRKAKGSLRQEFVILGYVPSTVAKGTVGALATRLLRWRRFALCRARRVRLLRRSGAALHRAACEDRGRPSPKSQNAIPAEAEKGVRWAEPAWCARSSSAAWTTDRLIRQAAFKGLREDRPAEEVRVESMSVKPIGTRTRIRTFRGRLTHPERILWPEAGVSKEGLAEFYADIADWILPHIAGRVLSLVRCPSGIAAKCFFAKHAWAGLSKAVKRVDVGEKEKMLTLDSIEGLIDLVQAGVLEIHPWGSAYAKLEQPDRLIFDLDPGEDVPWSAVIEGALDVRNALDDMDLTSFVKTSGGKGLHVVVPLTPSAGWDEAKAFTQSVAQLLAKHWPDRYVATMSKQKRRGKIFIDYLRNGRGSTAVAPYSTRASAARLGVDAAGLGRTVRKHPRRPFPHRQPAPTA